MPTSILGTALTFRKALNGIPLHYIQFRIRNPVVIQKMRGVG